MTALIHDLLPLAVAVAIGLVLGLERELAHKPAGLRTQLLVTVGTALFVLAAPPLGSRSGRAAGCAARGAAPAPSRACR